MIECLNTRGLAWGILLGSITKSAPPSPFTTSALLPNTQPYSLELRLLTYSMKLKIVSWKPSEYNHFLTE